LLHAAARPAGADRSAGRRRLFGTEPELADLPKQPVEPGEILGFADALSVSTLAKAYQAGLFPHRHIGTPKWLSPT
jgi:hypothetical protein